MEDDDMKLNPVKKVIKCKIVANENSNKVSYFDLLKMIKHKELDTTDLRIMTDNQLIYEWTDDCGFVKYKTTDRWYDSYNDYFTEDYDELDLVDLMVTILPKNIKSEDTPKIQATQKVIDILESMYMDLDMEIDNCQGCMSDLDMAMEELNIYKNLVKYLGGDIDKHMQELVDNWFNKANAEQKQKEKEQAERDKVIEKLTMPSLELIGVDKAIFQAFLRQAEKINEICDIIIKDKLEKSL